MRVIVDMLIIVTDKCDEKRKAKLMQIMQRAGIEGECKKRWKGRKNYTTDFAEIRKIQWFKYISN